jgi:signal transduction histidine kinase
MSSVIEAPRAGHRALPMGELLIPGAICLVSIAAVTSALAESPASARASALPAVLIGAGIVFSSGLADIARGRELRFARMLIGAGVLWVLSALSAASGDVLSSIGHVALWGSVLSIAFLLLSYPTGVLEAPSDRALFAGGTMLLIIMYLPTVLVSPQFPHPAPWTSCLSGCPSNAFSLTHSTPPAVHDFVLPARQALTALLFVGVAVAVVHRERRAGPLLGRVYAPIAAIAVSEAVLLIAYYSLRGVVPGSQAVTVLGWIFVASLPAITLARGAGRLYRRIYAVNALDRIAHNVSPGTGSARVRHALVEAIADPSLRILECRPGNAPGWVDESGAPVPNAQRPDERITEVADGARRIAIVHDPALADEPLLVDIAGTFALAALENDRLSTELQTSLGELAESRKRRLMAQLSERQKIERDLHDGAQQRLLALRVKLEMAATKLDSQDPEEAKLIRALGEEVDTTIDEIRSFARGIYPAVLARSGLEAALRGASLDAPLPTTVHASGLGRYPSEIEVTVYFSCLEALQNACKHASGATCATISIWDDGQLNFEVSDDGAAFDARALQYGTGLTNLSDRLAALGGKMAIRSGPGRGTVLSGSLPMS